MPRKSKAPAGTVEFVNKPETGEEPSILVPAVAIPEQGTPTEAPAPPSSPALPVKGKRPYSKKNGEYWKAVSKDRKGMLMPKPEPKVEPVPEPKNEIIMPTPEVVQEAPKKGKGRPRKVVPVAPVPVPVHAPPPTPAPVKQKKEKPVKPVKPPKPVKPVKAKPVKKVRVYEPSSDEESDYESEESESDDEAPVEVVAKKAVRRLKTLKKIDERIGQLNNSYSARGYSVF